MIQEPEKLGQARKHFDSEVNKVFRSGSSVSFQDKIAIEEALEIRLGIGPKSERSDEFSLSVTMRTPGDDFALVLGFLKSEGLIESYDDVLSIQHCGPPSKVGHHNIVRVKIYGKPGVNQRVQKRFFISSSACGLCGKSTMSLLQNLGLKPLKFIENLKLTPQILWSLRKELGSLQGLFRSTGGVHAAVVYRSDGKALFWGEDIGRHNALDKVIGQMLISRKVPKNHILMLSGRSSYELLQKSAIIKVPIVISVGAPSSAAVAIAKRYSITLLGFLGAKSVNVYNDPYAYCSEIY